MTLFSDAALLKGKFASMAVELREGKREAPKDAEWQGVACENTAEQTAQEVAKHIFTFQKAMDPKLEVLEVIAMCPAGPMKVLALIPSDGDILRLDGALSDGTPTSAVINSSQLALSFLRRPILNEQPEDDGLQIGFVIFDELSERKKQRDDKKNNSKADEAS